MNLLNNQLSAALVRSGGLLLSVLSIRHLFAAEQILKLWRFALVWFIIDRDLYERYLENSSMDIGYHTWIKEHILEVCLILIVGYFWTFPRQEIYLYFVLELGRSSRELHRFYRNICFPNTWYSKRSYHLKNGGFRKVLL